jgi:predicted dehydrogenase
MVEAMMTRTRIAVVGAGFGRYALVPAFRNDPRCEIVAICTRSVVTAARAAAELGISRAYADAATMFDDGGIDAVAVASPPSAQAQLVRLALSRSIPVFAEKLLALSVDDACALRDAAREAGVANAMDYIFPELDAWSAGRSLLEDGYIGVPRHLTVSWMIESHDQRYALETWKTDAEAGGGALHHFGPHVLHYVEWLLGSISHLSAVIARAPDSSRPGDTAADLCLEFANGASGTVSLSTAAPLGTGHRVEIFGSRGGLVLTNETNDPVRGFRLLAGNKDTVNLREVRRAENPSIPGLDSRVESVSRIASRFLDWIQTGKPMRPSFEDGARVQVLLDAAMRAHATGSRICVSNA